MSAVLAANLPYWAQSLLRVLGGTVAVLLPAGTIVDRKSTRLNSSH